MNGPSDAPAKTLELPSCGTCGRKNPMDARFCAGCGAPFANAPEAISTRPPPAPEADPLIGRVIADRYRIHSLLGRGGMGVVYKAEHVRIGKFMAMKLLRGELARDRDTVKRFKREAEAASRLSHPNTVQIFDSGWSEGLMYLVMEYVPGRDFGSVISEAGGVSFARAARICAQVCASVGEAHERGIVHRDLKPENIMVSDSRSQQDFVKVLDFGLAKLREAEEGARITRAGSIVGTPYYMAPEHIRGETVDHRADIYAIGAVLYKACCGVPPFVASSPVGVLTKHLTEDLVLPTERAADKNLPPEADRIITHAMARDPAARYQRAEDLRDDLLAYLSSIGELESGSGRIRRDPSSSISVTVGGAAKAPAAALATKQEVDRYERRIRRLSWLGWVLTWALVIGLAGAGYFAWQKRTPELATTEREPNNEPKDANEILEGKPLLAYLGKRISPTFSDADVYVLRNPGGQPRVLSVEVEAVPNMDILLEIVRAGLEEPVLKADSGGIGEPEVVPNFPIDGSRYFLRVREAWIAGRLPTENVSDAYRIAWRFVPSTPDDEHEMNDALEAANEVSVGQTRRGFIGWQGDVDTYCLAADAPAVVATVDAVQSLDLVLRAVNRREAESRKYDANGIGGAETTPVIRNAAAHATCFEVSITTDRQGARADARTPYVLHVNAAPSP